MSEPADAEPPATGPAAALAAAIAAIAADVAAQADTLNALDGVAGDGDLGITAGAAAAALAAAIPVVAPLAVPAGVRRIGTELARAVPSTGGTLVAFSFMAAGKALAEAEPGATSVRQVAIALAAAAESLATRGKVSPGDKTMLDAFEPAARAVAGAADAGLGLPVALALAAAAADAGAAATVSMRATVGRAGWLADRSQGHEDAGARLVAIALRAAADRTVSGRT